MHRSFDLAQDGEPVEPRVQDKQSSDQGKASATVGVPRILSGSRRREETLPYPVADDVGRLSLQWLNLSERPGVSSRRPLRKGESIGVSRSSRREETPPAMANRKLDC